METQHHRSNSGVKKRSSNACARCRQQKSKCSGTLPCTSCAKRNLPCTFDDSTKKILVTHGYLQDLQRRADRFSSNYNSNSSSAQHSAHVKDHGHGPTVAHTGFASNSVPTQFMLDPRHDTSISNHEVATEAHTDIRDIVLDHAGTEDSGPSSPGTDLVNPLAIDSGNYMADYLGRHFHLGASSNWAFGRRVLSTACDRLGLQIPVDQVYFEGNVYKLDWQSLSSGNDSSHEEMMPSSDYAIHLINAVKFHCGQMFHLFDEDMFMRHFSTFHGSTDGRSNVPTLWYTHYLLLIALAKLFVARGAPTLAPPGADLFLAAMKNWPEVVFGSSHTVECIEILICAALYLQCLDFRNAAFNLVGQALRKALDQGLHTRLSHRAPDSPVVQRCRHVWWTVYTLDRQITTLEGLPQAIRDDDISTPLPEPVTSKGGIGLELHVKLSRVIANIVNTVYGPEGRLPRKFLGSTKQALQSIAKVTELLSYHVEMPKNPSRGGISRFGAYLHLLNHQCICLTTRPLAFSFLDRRLQSSTGDVDRVIPKGSAQVLLRMCIDSAQQMLHILTALKDEGLLESFLPFDLEAVFIAAMVLIMARTIDIRLVEDHTFWTDMAYSILDDMSSRGNMIAVARKRELRHLTEVLNHANTPAPVQSQQHFHGPQPVEDNPIPASQSHFSPVNAVNHQNTFDDSFWQDEMTAEQLREIADSLDLDGFDWITTSLDGSTT